MKLEIFNPARAKLFDSDVKTQIFINKYLFASNNLRQDESRKLVV